jgi:hypothetical protein
MKICFAIFGWLSVCAVTFANLPGNWSNHHANSDFQKADAVIIGRVIEIRRKYFQIDEKDEPTIHAFTYVASIAIGKTFRGNLKTNDVINIPLGGYLQEDIDETQPTRISQCNSQNAYELTHNSVYLIALSRRESKSGEVYWEPRSGHKSIHCIELVYHQSVTNSASQVWTIPTPYKSIELPDEKSTNVEHFIQTYVLSTNTLYPNTDFFDINENDLREMFKDRVDDIEIEINPLR